ncbi:hypothetical protein ACHAQA_003231 [Verticillium albo-atrum]
MPPKTIILAGAPIASSLTWEPSTLLNDFTPPFTTFLNGDPLPEEPTSSIASWRSLPLTRQRLETGLSQLHAYPDAPAFQPDANFFTTTTSFTTTSSADSQGLASQFYDHSLAHHTALPSSPPSAPAPAPDETTSFLTTSTTSFASNPPAPPPQQTPHLSDLEDIPPAPSLLALHPQTVTINLIAGVIAAPPPRPVRTRYGKTMLLLELLLADDTRAGFAVTFWLADDAEGAASPLRGLRRQDVVLLRDVALNVFRGKVYGQSLRRGRTKVSLLYRRKLEGDVDGGYYSEGDLRGGGHPQVDKVRKVRDWMLRFVGGQDEPGGDKRGGKRGWDRPPDDTQ